MFGIKIFGTTTFGTSGWFFRFFASGKAAPGRIAGAVKGRTWV